MDLVHTMVENATNQKKRKPIILNLKFENGLVVPTSICELLEIRHLKREWFSFSDDFGFKNPSKLYWKNPQLNQQMISFVKFLQFNGIEIETTKLTGEIFYLTFIQKNIVNLDMY